MSQQTAFVTDDSPSPELVNEINDAFNSNDVSAIMPYFTDDASFNTTRGPGAEGNTYQGKEAIEGAFKALFDSVENRALGASGHPDRRRQGLLRIHAQGALQERRGHRMDDHRCDHVPRRPDDAKEQLHQGARLLGRRVAAQRSTVRKHHP